MGERFEIRCAECGAWTDGDLDACEECGTERDPDGVVARGGGLNRIAAVLLARPKGYG